MPTEVQAYAASEAMRAHEKGDIKAQIRDWEGRVAHDKLHDPRHFLTVSSIRLEAYRSHLRGCSICANGKTQ